MMGGRGAATTRPRMLSDAVSAIAVGTIAARIAGLQISGQLVGVALRQRMLHEFIAEMLALARGIDSDEWQIPVGFVRVETRHLFEHPRGILLNGRRRCLLDQRAEGFFIGRRARWQPQRHAREVIDAEGSAEGEGFSAERSREQWHVPEEVIGFGPGPAGGWVGDEREHDACIGRVGGSFVDAVNGGSFRRTHDGKE